MAAVQLYLAQDSESPYCLLEKDYYRRLKAMKFKGLKNENRSIGSAEHIG